jgi:hypothetical protein
LERESSGSDESGARLNIVVKHRTYRAAAHESFPYADFDAGDGRFAVVRRCARFYRRGYHQDHWRRWRFSLFLTEDLAEANLNTPCEDWSVDDGIRHVLCSRGDHFLFILPRVGKDIKKPAPIQVPKVEPEKQGRLF